MMAKPMKTLEWHYPMIQFLIKFVYPIVRQICPGLTLIRCMQISISVTKCLIALLLNFNITRFPEY